MESPLPITDIIKKRGRLEGGPSHFVSDSAASTPRLNNRGLAFANRSFALTPTTGKAKRENYRTDCNQELFHRVTPAHKFIEKYRYFSIYNWCRKVTSPGQRT